jgi:hypothetical protein
MLRKTLPSALVALLLIGGSAVPALACAGLVAPNGSVRLTRTATLAGYHNGIEHYVTSFQFRGGGAKFGSIVPLPDVPSKVTRGGKWTLQRLAQETQPPAPVAADGESSGGGTAKELYETEIDGLLITILEGGGRAVGRWAKKEGFSLTPDAPEVLSFYARRSKIFMAARFIPEKAKKKKLQEGDGIPIHLRIPTDNPWVPLRILGLGKNPGADIAADVYLLTDIEPAVLPSPVEPGERGLVKERSEQASDTLLDDLRSDKGMSWIPDQMWLMYLRVDSDANKLSYDLAIDASGAGSPDVQDAYGAPPKDDPGDDPDGGDPGLLLGLIFVPAFGLGFLRSVHASKRHR